MKKLHIYFPISFLVVLASLTSCQNLVEADLVVHNAKIYTVDSVFSIEEAMAIKDGKVLEVGAENQIRNKYRAAKEIDAKLRPIYPGFIDGHCHFLGYGLGFFKVNLVGTNSWNEVLQKVIEFAELNPEGWIEGRGWDQNDWELKEFPSKIELDSLFPDRAVILQRIDGHAAIANSKALELANIDLSTKVDGGIFEIKEGELSGILIDNAVERVHDSIPSIGNEKNIKALKMAEENCFSVGLTTLSDAGTSFETVELIKELHKNGDLKIRVYSMLSPSEENKNKYYQEGIYTTDRLNIRSFKYYADGALGSRGAFLKEEYADDEGNHGLMLTDSTSLIEAAQKLHEIGFQMNTHCIGDNANKIVTEIYASTLGGSNDKRWRIEHSQVVDEEDLLNFKNYNIIPSVQPTHATSDMYWLEERLGKERAKNAYANKVLMSQNGLIALGTDFPVEGINPLNTFYAAVYRKDQNGFPEGGFQMENALSKEEALKGMTIWNAIANFEENEKGSLEKGKLADFVILDKDILEAAEEDILSTKVIATYVNGEEVYSMKE